jgi:hypothetical protein
MARKKLNESNQTDGKIRSEEDSENPQYQPTTLSQLFGETNGSERYGTLDADEYRTTLEGFNSAELRRHAIEVAHVVPAISSERTIKRLLLEFQKYTLGFTTPRVTHKKDKTPSEEALRIMAECK